MNLELKFSGFDSDYLEMISEQKKEQIASLKSKSKPLPSLEKISKPN